MEALPQNDRVVPSNYGHHRHQQMSLQPCGFGLFHRPSYRSKGTCQGSPYTCIGDFLLDANYNHGDGNVVRRKCLAMQRCRRNFFKSTSLPKLPNFTQLW